MQTPASSQQQPRRRPWLRAVLAGLRRAHLWLVRSPQGLDPRFADFYPLSNYVHGMGLLAHLSFLLLFWRLDAPVLMVFNAFSVVVFVLTFWFSRRGWLDPALLLGGLEVAAHQGLAVLYLGLEAGFQHYVLILVMGTLFYSHIALWLRVVMAILPALWYLGLLVYGLHALPLLPLNVATLSVLAVFNAILFVGILMGMAIYYQYAVARARDRAERMAASKTLFLANMSHELRTPLNAILGYAQILGRSPDIGLAHRTKLTSINRSGEHLLTLINRILDMSKLEEGKLELVTAPFDLDQLLDEVRDMFSQTAVGKGLSLMLQRAPDVPTALDGDALRLRQVLINLVGNAVKFTPQGSVQVSVLWAAHPSRAARDSLRLRFEVQDTGIGISRAERADLFQIFTQTESGRRSRQGTGLGLALSRRIVELMGGEMGVLSSPGRGTQFWFEVQLRPATCAPAIQPLPAPSPADFTPALDLPSDEPLQAALASLQPLPRAELLRLHEAVQIADYDAAEQLLATQAGRADGIHPWLRQQLADYRFDRLQALTAQAVQALPPQP